MLNTTLLKLCFLSIALLALLTTTWLVISRGAITQLSGSQKCSCPADGTQLAGKQKSMDRSDKLDKEGLEKKLEKCRKDKGALRERLDWEMSKSDWKEDDKSTEENAEHRKKPVTNLSEIQIVVNSHNKVKGVQKGQDVYVPFSFIRKYLEVHGEYSTENDKVFIWKHAVIRRWKIPEKYVPSGEYVGLSEAFVEKRKRVKCLHGKYEVPVSTQWNKNGYFYATQIAQYGLAHYSKFLKAEDKNQRVVLQDDKLLGDWSKTSAVTMVIDKMTGKTVTSFGKKASFNLNKRADIGIGQNVLSVDVNWKSGSSLVVAVKTTRKETIFINYVDTNDLIYSNFPKIFIGLGVLDGWRKITRDVETDFYKGYVLLGDAKNAKSKFKNIHKISFFGSGYVSNLTLSNTAHVTMFMNAANWFLKFQDKAGGWPVNCTRKIIHGVSSPPGWYSAMGSGQAISLLCRVYLYTKDPKYIRAARNALKLFNVSVEDNGFVSTVFNAYKMFEEYPTMPSVHVLNGFIFSLIGLYDLAQTDNGNPIATQHLNQGLDTLLRVLPLYDSGSGTFYDLRHFVIPGVEPNRARWDYHAVHLGQLKLLKQIVKNPSIDKILQRWDKYADGIPAKHN